MKRQSLYAYQYAFLVIFSCLCNLFLIGVMEEQTGSAAWTAFLIALPIGMAMLLVFTALFARHPGKSLYEIHVYAFGKPLGSVISLAYGAYFMVSGSVLLNYYGLYTVDTVLVQLRLISFVAPIVLAMIYVARKGVEVMGRIAVILGSIFAVACVAGLLLELITGNGENLFPIAALPAGELVQVAFGLAVTQFGELIAVVSFMPHVVRRRRIVKITLLSALGTNLLVALMAVGAVMLSGQEGAAFFHMARGAAYSGLVGGMNLLVAGAYFFGAVFRITIALGAAARAVKDVFGVRSSRQVVLGAGAVMAALAQLLSFSAEVTGYFILYVWPYIAVWMQAGLPLLALALGSLRQRMGRKEVRPCGGQ